MLPLRCGGCVAGKFCHRYYLPDRGSQNAYRDAGRCRMIKTAALMSSAKKKNEFLYFAFKNIKLRIGLGIVLFFLVLTFVGPKLTKYKPSDFVGPSSARPSSTYWFGTTSFGEDVFTQFVYGLSSTFLVG